MVNSYDLLELLKEESNTEHVAFTEFMLSYSNDDTTVCYCFYEGDEDTRYYASRIKAFIGESEYLPFSCGGRDRVKKIIKLIENRKEYESAITFFFIDKDYTSEEISSKLYVTPCYSIENFYSSQATLVNILLNEFNIPKTHADYQKIINIFLSIQNKFHNKMLLINSWLACQSDLRLADNEIKRLNIDSTLSKYFKGIVKDNLEDISDFSDLNNLDTIQNILFPTAEKIPHEVVKNKLEAFKDNNNFSYDFRGKFELYFFVSFLIKLKNEVCKKDSSIFTHKRKCSLVFSKNNAISNLSQYADTPGCINDFIINNLS